MALVLAWAHCVSKWVWLGVYVCACVWVQLCAGVCEKVWYNVTCVHARFVWEMAACVSVHGCGWMRGCICEYLSVCGHLVITVNFFCTSNILLHTILSCRISTSLRVTWLRSKCMYSTWTHVNVCSHIYAWRSPSLDLLQLSLCHFLCRFSVWFLDKQHAKLFISDSEKACLRGVHLNHTGRDQITFAEVAVAALVATLLLSSMSLPKLPSDRPSSLTGSAHRNFEYQNIFVGMNTRIAELN